MSRHPWACALMLGLAPLTLGCPGTPPEAAPPKKATVNAKKVTPSPSASPDASPTPAPTATPGDNAITAVASASPSPAPLPSPSSRITVRTGEPTADTWLTGPTLQRARAGHAAGHLAGVLTVFEGDVQPTLEVLDAATGAWRLDESVVGARAPGGYSGMSQGRSFAASAAWRTDFWLIGGSYDAGIYDDMVQFKTLDTFGTQPQLLYPAVQGATAGIVGERLIVAGGLDAGSVVQKATQVFMLPDLDTSAGAELPLAVAGASSVAVGGRLWVFGGYELEAGRPVARAAVQVYDPVKDTWLRDGGGTGAPAPLPVARHSAAAAELGGKVYLVGGLGPDGKPVAQVDVLDPVAGTWSQGAALPTARALLALVAHEGRLWAIGGMGADERPSGVVEVYRP